MSKRSTASSHRHRTPSEEPAQGGETWSDKTERDRRRRRFTPEFLVFLGTTLLVTLAVSLLLSPLAQIEEVTIEGNQILSDEKILAQAQDPIGQNVFLYSTRQGAQSLELDPYVDRAKVSRRPLHGLLIQVQERAPVGILVDGDAYLHFASDGMLMDVSESLQTTKLPIITGLSLESIPAPGEKIEDQAFYQALEVANACSPDFLREVQEINVSKPNDILAYTSHGIEIRVGRADETIKDRIQSLEDIFTQIVLPGALPAPVDYIDIRYQGSPSIKMIGYDAPIVELNNLESIDVPEDSDPAAEEEAPAQPAS